MKVETIEEMKVVAQRIWTEKMTPQFCQNLVNGLPKRLAKVLAHNGKPVYD